MSGICSDIRYLFRYPVFVQISGICSGMRYLFRYPVFVQMSGISPDIRYSFRCSVFLLISGVHSDVRYSFRCSVFVQISGISSDLRYFFRYPVSRSNIRYLFMYTVFVQVSGILLMFIEKRKVIHIRVNRCQSELIHKPDQNPGPTKRYGSGPCYPQILHNSPPEFERDKCLSVNVNPSKKQKQT